jgi:predicted metal-binding membrane protein
MWTDTSDSRAFLPVTLGLVLSAWVVLAVWGASPAAYLLDHRALGEAKLALNGSHLVAIGLFVLGWNLMTIAMMLPTVIPLLSLLRRSVRAAYRTRVTAFAIVGYLAVWSCFGALAVGGDFLIHHGVRTHAWLHANEWVLGTVPLTVAGAYQFSPLKRLCLDGCRSPFSFIASHWSAGSVVVRGLRTGIDHGVSCVGCCWTLMLLMFAVSAGNLAWMFALAAVMGIEKNASWGNRLTAPLGVVLLSAGATALALNL